jgi:hypothetical protein
MPGAHEHIGAESRIGGPHRSFLNNLTLLEIPPFTETEFNSASSTGDVPVAGHGVPARRFFNNAHAFGGATLIELHDQEWFPKILRDYVTDALQFILNLIRVYGHIVPRLNKAIQAAGTARVVDLCSGGGGPWLWLHKSLQNTIGLPITVCMTDKYPNIRAFEGLRRQTQDQVTFYPEAVNAANLPTELSGFRTIFTSFHHLQPQEALAILQNAVNARQGIGVFEAARRQPITVLSTILMFVGGLLTAPFIRPFRLSRLCWTYLIPVIPFVLFFDGVISCLRSYSKDELTELVLKVKCEDYVWEIGEEPGGLAPVTFLIGYPKTVFD